VSKEEYAGLTEEQADSLERMRITDWATGALDLYKWLGMETIPRIDGQSSLIEQFLGFTEGKGPSREKVIEAEKAMKAAYYRMDENRKRK
jgi:hypothetical protein